MTISYKIKKLSYSSLLSLHACPRKFQLNRLNAREDEGDEDANTKTVLTFAFGHAVGDGIQQVLSGVPEDTIIMNLFLSWHAELFAENTKQHKSFWLALLAVQKFIVMRSQGYLEDYELVSFNRLPATELSFRVTFPNGFFLRGFLDAVLRNKKTGQVIVLEVKTSSATSLNSASYKNSAQAIGYSVVIDVLFPDISSYDVIYLVYLTKSKSYEQLVYTKSYAQRALWIQELLLDIESIKTYEKVGVYPMRGESCYSFFRECEYLNLCTLSTAVLVSEGAEREEKKEEYQIDLTLEDLINAQYKKLNVM